AGARSGDGQRVAGNGAQHGETAEAAGRAETAGRTENVGRTEGDPRTPKIRATAAVGKAH
ncbi:hypothetical protein, partial [Kitasatospora sp. NPDC047058]|uniref:hypothetical protein n=1 Tax=Kitasatospora sp. NPDC047058 TaxID=3155620 RepID=UPI00340D51BE